MPRELDHFELALSALTSLAERSRKSQKIHERAEGAYIKQGNEGTTFVEVCRKAEISSATTC